KVTTHVPAVDVSRNTGGASAAGLIGTSEAELVSTKGVLVAEAQIQNVLETGGGGCSSSLTTVVNVRGVAYASLEAREFRGVVRQLGSVVGTFVANQVECTMLGLKFRVGEEVGSDYTVGAGTVGQELVPRTV